MVEVRDVKGHARGDFTEAELWNFSPRMTHVDNAKRIQASAQEAYGVNLNKFRDLIPDYANTNNTNHGEWEKIEQGKTYP
jgi:hypothetical protein